MAFRQYLFNKFQSVIPSLVNGQSWPTVIDATGSLSMNPEGRRATYRATASTIVASGISSAPFLSIGGSNSKLIRITRVYFSNTAATGATTTFSLVRYAGFTGGSLQPITTRPLDINNPTPQANVQNWLVAPTAISPTLLSQVTYEVVTASVSVLPQIIDWSFGDKSSQPVVVRGSSDFVGIAIANPGTTPNANFWMEWTEE